MPIVSDRSGRTALERVDDEAAVRRDILLLSTLLEGVRPGDSTALYRSNINQVGELSVWSHVTSILSAWSSGDSASSPAVVTGRLEPDRIVAAAITTSSPPISSVLTETHSLLAKQVRKLSPETVSWLLHHIDDLRADVPQATHLRDTISIVEWLSSALVRAEPSTPSTSNCSAASEPPEDYTFLVFSFIMKRGYKQLFTRLRTGNALWHDHPLTVIRNIYCQGVGPAHTNGGTVSVGSAVQPSSTAKATSSDATQLPVSPKLRIRSFPLKNLTKFRRLLELHDIHEVIPYGAASESDADVGTYAISSSNAASWAELLQTCYTTLLGSVSRVTPCSSELEAEPPETRAERVALYEAMVALHQLLRAGIVNHLVTESVRKELEGRYIKVMEVKSPLLDAAFAAALSDGSHEMPTGHGAEYDANDIQGDGELTRRHVLRYLYSLVEPYSAAAELIGYFSDKAKSASPLTFDIYHIHSTTSLSASGHGFSDFGYDRIAEDLFESPDARGPSSDGSPTLLQMRGAMGLVKEPVLARAREKAKVHPEAALISTAAGGLCGHARTVQDKVTQRNLHEVFAGGMSRDNAPVILESGRRCCYCCALLAQSLRPWSEYDMAAGTEGEESDARPLRPLKFILEPDGTHGTIEPWVPPDGVAPDELCAIRMRLLDIFRRNIVERTTRDTV